MQDEQKGAWGMARLHDFGLTNLTLPSSILRVTLSFNLGPLPAAISSFVTLGGQTVTQMPQPIHFSSSIIRLVKGSLRPFPGMLSFSKFPIILPEGKKNPTLASIAELTCGKLAHARR